MLSRTSHCGLVVKPLHCRPKDPRFQSHVLAAEVYFSLAALVYQARPSLILLNSEKHLYGG